MRNEKKRPSSNRIYAREMEKKFIPAIKAISEALHKTSPEVPTSILHGYEALAGNLKSNGMQWQLQVRAVCTKKLQIKNNIVKPIISKKAIMFKIRVFVKGVIDEIFKD